MDEFFRAIISITRVIREGSEERERCFRMVTLMVTLAVSVIVIAAALTILLRGAL